MEKNTFCQNESCAMFGKKNAKNIMYKSKKANIFYCKKCGKSFSSTRGSFLYNRKTPTKIVLRSILSIAHGKALRKTARDERVTTDSIIAWISQSEKFLPEVLLLLRNELNASGEELERFRIFIKEKSRKMDF